RDQDLERSLEKDDRAAELRGALHRRDELGDPAAREHVHDLVAEDEEAPEHQRVEDAGAAIAARLSAFEELELAEGVLQGAIHTLGNVFPAIRRPHVLENREPAVGLERK